MSLKDASALTPEIDLSNVISDLAQGQEVNRLIVTAPKYMKELQAILKETDDATLQSYFVWKAVQALYPYVDSPILKPYKGFVNELAGKVVPLVTLGCHPRVLTFSRILNQSPSAGGLV